MEPDLLVGADATRARVMAALSRAASVTSENDLFVFYLSGVATVGNDGKVRWLLADSTKSDGLTAADLNRALDQIRARHKVLLIDSCHAGAIGL
jgi:predicted RNA-binding protein